MRRDMTSRAPPCARIGLSPARLVWFHAQSTVSLLTGDEIAWVDAYHARVRESLAPQLEAEVAEWLATATAPLTARI